MLGGLFDDDVETVYGHGRSFSTAAERAYGSLSDEGYLEALDDEGIDPGSWERYLSPKGLDTDAEAEAGYEVKVVAVT